MSIDYTMPEDAYHARPELSSTGARLLLRSPRTFQWAQTHPQPHKAVFDVGSAVHAKVLGVGAPTIAIPDEILASNGAASTKAAKDFIADARNNGAIPMKQAELDEVDAIVASVLDHQEARRLVEQPGNPEASVFATDPDTGVEMRARFDHLPNFTVTDPYAVDLKSARDASPEGFAKAVAEHRYDIQMAWYERVYGVTTGDFMMRMKFIAVEKEAPFLVGVYDLSAEFADMGRRRTQQALEIYAACTEANLWPGYASDVPPLQPPSWLMFTEGAIA